MGSLSGTWGLMGGLVAGAGTRDWDELTAKHGAQLMEGLAVMGTRGKHVNVLQHHPNHRPAPE
jgi:uncharacterized protein YbgA (DUF1722 family)